MGSDPVEGGGVARAISLIQKSSIFNEASVDYYSLLNTSKLQQLIFLLKNLKYRKFIIHSFFSPFSIFLLALPLPCEVLLMPHGELREGALNVNGVFKNKIIRVLTFLLKIYFFKKIFVIASGHEEISFVSKICKVEKASVLPDVIPNIGELEVGCNFDSLLGVSIILNARMVENKGISKFLSTLELHILNGKMNCDLIHEIFIFYLEESEAELQKVLSLVARLNGIADLKVNMISGYGNQEIRDYLRNVPNKIGFISSRFESFSYALIESLFYEYKPIVWFENSLTDELIELGMCRKMQYGDFDLFTQFVQLSGLSDISSVEKFISSKNLTTNMAYRDFVFETLRLESKK
ncbi:hypothetical protein LIN78_04400 [Leeia sp. TBRC 13508]|uniref:Glycosyltransferase n=1 Tax=Leeia speluncae TaxID=2884804 RepID=A0ABS8D3M0_9NEIS|nr:hypothetical protein [Leeia speluncae]MCB6182790.1 hypothetical protein [Leeia speluncae]